MVNPSRGGPGGSQWGQIQLATGQSTELPGAIVETT